ncbi:LrgB family protein [Blastococcus deserti]|uniref:LrgB family protein n=1 Tax=Blastococcus deserti TaxID=2259033 RepID=A0ABW4XET0_9ACTN
MTGDLYSIWVYLAETPLVGLTLTLASYVAGSWLHRLSGSRAILNPVLLAVTMTSVVLAVTGIDYRTYFEGAQFVHFLLGPATVALAVPLYRQLPQLRRLALPLLAAVGVGSLTAIVTAIAIPAALGAADQTLVSLAPKSATAPVAMGVSELLGGAPSLTAVFTILTGITGAVCGGAVLDLVRVRDHRARGLAIGVVAHGIGTAREMQVHPTSGAFAGLGLALNAVTTALLVPLLFTVVPPLVRLTH